MKRFMPVLRCELKKAFCNWWMLVCLAVGIGLVVYHACTYLQDSVYWLESCHTYSSVRAPDYSPLSCYCRNILTGFEDVASWLFFTLAPLMITLAYAWSYQSERSTGYVYSMLVRTDRVSYYAAKYCATFIAGGTVVVVPLIASYITAACMLPAYMPDHFDFLYIIIQIYDFLGSLFWSNPALYMVAHIALDFVFAGLWATFVLALSLVIKNRVALIVVPYICMFLLKELGDRLHTFTDLTPVSLTLFDQLRGHAEPSINYTWVLIVEMLLLFVAGIAIPYLLKGRDVL